MDTMLGFKSGATVSMTAIGETRARRPDRAWKPRGGTVEERAANAPIPLEDPDEVFYIEEGSVDIFSAPAAVPGKPPGARRFLWTVERGETLFGFGCALPGQGHSFVGVCNPGTRLRRYPIGEIEEASRRDHALFVEIVEGFVARLAGAMVLRPQLDVILARHEKGVAAPGKVAGTLGEMLWVKHMEGSTTFGGLPEVVFGPDSPPIPLYKGMWLEAGAEGATFYAFDTQFCIGSGEAFEGLDRIRSVFHICAARVAQFEESSEEDRLGRKSVNEERMRSQGIANLASVLTGSAAAAAAAAAGDEDDPLVRACRIIGDVDGIVFKGSPKWETQGRTRDPLAALCRASRVRSRRVTLRGEWWKHDCGNLLAFVEKTESPVAILYNRRGYEMVDPMTMERRPVTAEVAAELNWESYVFYRPLPDEKIDGKGLLKRVLGENRNDIRFILLMALAAGLLTLLVPIATGHMLGKIVPNALKNQVWMLMLGLIGVHIGVALFNLTRAFTLVRLEGRSNSSLQSAVVDRMLALPVPFFRDNPVGELAMRALSINQSRAILTGAASTSILAGIFSVVYLILLVYYNWRLALLSLAVMVVTLVWVMFFAKRAVKVQRENLAVRGKVSALVFQMITGIAKLRVAAAESRLFAKWAERFKDQAVLNYRSRIYQNAIKVYNDLLPLLSSLVLFWTAGYLHRNGHPIDTATFIAFNLAFGSLFAALAMLSDTVVHIMGVKPIIERAKPILETVPEVEQSKPDPGALSGRIEVNHLTFSYKKDAPLVLDDVSMYALPGEFIAVVGPSGSGKSTTLRMLLGFEQPDSGVVYYDGQDLRSVDLSGIRSQMGVVLQNSRLISGTVFDNIVGSAPLSMEEAWAAADMAGLSADIKDFPMGMHTVVSEGGGNLSGGQQQRLLIARALVRKPRILFFDEATSALDNRVQEVVSASLERLNATRVVIAHRLSTIRRADRIYVMDKGKVLQTGSFDELTAQPGMFADLMARQTL